MITSIILFLIGFSHIGTNDAFKIQPRIVNGYTASAGQFPFFAFLDIEHPEPNKSLACGASLISDQWVLTAAHCLQGVTNLTVHLGKTVLNKHQEGHVYIPVKAKDFYIYPWFHRDLILNDIGRFIHFHYNLFA